MPRWSCRKDELEGMPQGLRGNGIEALHPRVTGHAVNAIDGLQITFCSLFVKREQGRCFEGKTWQTPTSAHHPGESLRRPRLHLRCRRSSREASGKAHRRKDIYVLLVPQWTLQPTPRLTSSTCAIPSQEIRIVAFMFTKRQLDGWRGYWDFSTSGNGCWALYVCLPIYLTAIRQKS